MVAFAINRGNLLNGGLFTCRMRPQIGFWLKREYAVRDCIFPFRTAYSRRTRIRVRVLHGNMQSETGICSPKRENADLGTLQLATSCQLAASLQLASS